MMKIAVLLAIVMIIAGCGSTTSATRETVPAEKESQRLGEIQETSAITAAESTALADRLDEQMSKITEPIQRSKLQAQYDAARLAAAIASAKRDAAAELRAAADKRAKAEREELEVLDAARAKAAAEQADRERAATTRWWSVLGLGGCVAAAIVLRGIGLPLAIAGGIPGAISAGLACIIAFTSAPWIALVLGYSLAAAVIVALIVVLRFVAREWLRYAEALDAAMPDVKESADDASKAAQNPWILRIVNHLLAAAQAKVSP